MARYISHPDAGSIWAGGIAAGIVGGFLFDGFLFAVGKAHYPFTYEWIASGVLGKSAFVSPAGTAIGVALHFGISIVAAILYGYASQLTGLLGRPLVAGMLFGVVMNVVMDVIAYGRGLATLPSGWHNIGIQLAAHVIFFGIPIAWLMSRYERVAIPYT